MTRLQLGVLLTLSLALNAGFIGAWLAGRDAEEGDPVEPANAPALWDDLELDPAEETRLRAHWDELGEDASEISTELEQDRRRLFALLQADTPDFEAIVEVQEALGENQERLREMVVRKMLEAGRELDPEARRRWAARLHEYAEERSRRKPWNRPGHRRYGRVPAGHRDRDLEEMLADADVTVESSRIPRGVELRFRPEDPEDTDRLEEEVREWFRGKVPRRPDHDRDRHEDGAARP
jgi:uncharacterized membrane protein